MADPLTRFEIVKLAHELDVDPDELDFLLPADRSGVAALRHDIAMGLAERQSSRFTNLATLARLVPSGVAAKVAQFALGPRITAGVAGVLEPAHAVRLAQALGRDYLADVSKFLDPEASRSIIAALPDDLVVDVGRRLLDRHEYLTIGRFVDVVTDDVAMQVVEGASGYQLLQVSLFADNLGRLDSIVGRLDDVRIRGIIAAAIEGQQVDEIVAVVTRLQVDTQTRLMTLVAEHEVAQRNRFVAALAEWALWADLVPAANAIADEPLRRIANVPVTCDLEVVSAVVATARDLGLADLLVRIALLLDTEHIGVVERLPALADAGFRDWLVDTCRIDDRMVRGALASLTGQL